MRFPWTKERDRRKAEQIEYKRKAQERIDSMEQVHDDLDALEKLDQSQIWEIAMFGEVQDKQANAKASGS